MPNESQFDETSGKEKRHVMRYHVAVTLGEGYIVHMFGPYQGASNDLNLLHDPGFLDMREDDEWTLGDGIYSCTEKILPFF